MAATPIPAHLIYTVFQYILPPSLPLPSHLLSKPLAKRHHFLGISPTDAVSYLCWPSSDATQIAEALEFSSQEGLMSPPEHDVRYSSPDPETLFAHVRPHSMSPLQVVFAWDEETGSWRYHDARMLPFPAGSSSSFDVALAQRPHVSESLENGSDGVGPATGSSSPASENYWAGYDSSGSSPSTSVPANNLTEEDDSAEAAYWASYGAVHGSGDSTVPSPVPEKRRAPLGQTEGDLRGPDIPTDPLITHLHLRLHEHNGLLSPRLRSRPEHSEEPGLSVTKEDPKSEESVAVSGDLKIIRSYHSDNPSGDDPYASKSQILGKSNDQEVNEGVKDAVRGVYRMWKARTQLEDVGVFMELVKSAVETL